MSPAKQLLGLIEAPGCVLAPGAFDAWSARIIGQGGFACCYMTGFGVAASFAGVPDLGLLGAAEMADAAARIVDAAGIPVIADADTGYGNAIHVRGAVRAYRRAGVAAIQIEDQEWPKRCGHLDGKRVIAADDMVGKIRAAKDSAGGEVLVIARTDARAVLGLDQALARAAAYRDAGADILFVEAPQTRAELDQVARALLPAPLIANMVEGGKTPYLPVDELGRIGFKIAIFPITALLAATRAMQTTLKALKRDGAGQVNALASFGDLHAISGLDQYLAFGRDYDGPARKTKGNAA